MTDAPISELAQGAAIQTTQADGGSPVFILTASRSGSTLLRFILDSHPDLACPPETMTGSACAVLIRLYYSLENFGAAERTDVHAPPAVSPEGLKAIRESIDNAFSRYLEQRGKKRWCDKSLDTYQFAELILDVYPEARFICLVRHCMDVIASGVRNCPWGVGRYGFDPFVAQYPGNSVAAIGAYWLSCNQAILGFYEKNPDRCIIMRYEDLVAAPEEVTADALAFIGARPAPGITRACFAVPHESRGPGDEKIWFTDRVSADSVGQGVAVPAIALPPEMRASINEVLARLGYRTVGDDWESAVGSLDPRADAARGPEAHGLPEASGLPAAGGDQIESAIRALRERLDSGSVTMSRRVLSQWPSVADVTVRLVAEMPSGDHAEVSWRFPAGNGTKPPEGGAGAVMMTAAPATWMSLLEGGANVMNEILAGRLRCFNPNDTHRIRSDEVHALSALLGLAPVPVQPL
jgi:Sulfotransferase family